MEEKRKKFGGDWTKFRALSLCSMQMFKVTLFGRWYETRDRTELPQGRLTMITQFDRGMV